MLLAVPSSAGQAPGAGQSVCSSCPEITPVGSFAANSGADASAVQMPSRPCAATGGLGKSRCLV
jgi:hypothetical protein